MKTLWTMILLVLFVGTMNAYDVEMEANSYWKNMVSSKSCYELNAKPAQVNESSNETAQQESTSQNVAVDMPDNIDMEYLTEEEQEWAIQGVCEAQILQDFTRFFRPVRGCEFSKEFRPKGDFCADDGTNDYPFAYFTLKRPLRLKGRLEIINKGSSECKNVYTVAVFHSNVPEGKGLDGYSIDFSRSPKALRKLESTLPQWFKDGAFGSVWYEVEFDVINRQEKIAYTNYYGQKYSIKRQVAIKAQKAECGLGNNKILAKNIIVRKMDSSKDYKEPRQSYQTSDMDINGFYLSTDYIYSNLRAKPNGRILTRMHKGEKDDILIYKLSDRSAAIRTALRAKLPKTRVKKSSWHKVIYFPPYLDNGDDAIIGYVHNSQVEGYNEEYKVH